MNVYSTPTIIKETLSNGGKIPVIIYQMNPLRDPNKRINHYRNIFQNESPLFSKTQISFKNLKNINSLKKSRKKKRDVKSVKNKLYNSSYKQLFLRINYERPREIINENGIIISRHFRTLDINSKEYPDQKIRSFYFNDKIPTKKKINYRNKGSFFSTEIRYPLNKNNENINVDINKRKYNSISNSNNIFSKTVYASNNINNKFFNIENYNMKNINHKKFNVEKRHDSHEIPPLLIYNKKKISNSIKKLNNDIYNAKNVFKVKKEEKKIF